MLSYAALRALSPREPKSRSTPSSSSETPLIGDAINSFKANSRNRARIGRLYCANERATSPAVMSVTLSQVASIFTFLGEGGTITNPKGVTVIDLLEGIAEAWREAAYFDSDDG